MYTKRTSFPIKGVTLPELVMTLFIGTLLLSVVPVFCQTTMKLFQHETGRLGATERADLTLQRMEKEVRNARRVTLSADTKTITLVLPLQQYDYVLGHNLNYMDASGRLTDGDQIKYYFVGSTSSGGNFHRQLTHADGTQEPSRIVTANIYPSLNPLATTGGSPKPLFAYDDSLRKLTISVTAAEVEPSSTNFSPRFQTAFCRRDGGQLVRVSTLAHPEGEINCSICGSRVLPTAKIASYATRLFLRNR